MSLSKLVASTALLFGLAQGYANPGSCSGACNVHDPSLIRRQSDGVYFRFSTGNKISYASSSSIAGPWTTLGSMLPAGSSINLAGNTDLWAPDAQLIDGTYYVFYSVSTFGSQNSAIGVATSSTMNSGTWTDRGATGVRSSSSKAYNAIDSNVINADGTYYMNFGSFWGDIYQVPVSGGVTPTGSSYQIAYDPSGSHAVEGAYMYKYGSYYYLFFSAGICCGYDTSRPAAGEEYKIKVCRSTSPTGGFVRILSCIAIRIIQLTNDRSMRAVFHASKVGALLSLKAMEQYMGLVGRVSSLTRASALSFTTITWIPPLDMPMARSALDGMSLTSQAVGLWFKRLAGPACGVV